MQIQANGTEQGYNTDASAQFNEKPGHTTSLLLANIPTVVGDGSNGTVEGMVYRQFVLDANEPNGGSKNLLSLDSLQIWQEESGNLTNFTPGSGFAGAHTNHLAYNMDAGSDAWVAINSGLSSGSGGADMVLLIPDSYFINNTANKYVTLYSAFGQQGSDWNSGGGFEEWGVRGGGSGAPGAPTPALTIDKIAAAPGGVADHAGEVINYTINVENTGNTNLTTVTLSDTLLKGPNGTLNAPIESLHADGILEVGETWTYKGTYTVQQADIDNGTADLSLNNTATVHTDQTANQSASAAVPILFHPEVALTKAAVGDSFNDLNGNGRPDAGETINYTFDIANSGNVTLHGISLTDLVPAVTLTGTPIDTLAPGAHDNTSFTASYTITQADIDAGFFNNSAQAIVIDPGVDPPVATSHTVLPQDPHLTVEKTGTWVDGPENNHLANPGELINYSFTVTNDGNVTLHGLDLTDPLVTNIVRGADISGNGDNIFDVGETWSFTGSYAINQTDIDAGHVHNTVTAEALGPQNQPTDGTADNNTTLPQHIEMSLVKTGTLDDANHNGFADPDETINYSFTIANEGNVTLHNIEVNDPESGVTVSGSAIASLAPGASNNTSWSASHVVTQDDINSGSFTNTATATATETSASGSTTVALPAAPAAMTLNNSNEVGTVFVDHNEQGPDANGDLIEFVYALTNNGGVSLHNVALNDPLTGVTLTSPDSPDPNGTLDPGETWVFSHNYFLTGPDVAAGHVNDDPTATALDPSNQAVNASAHFTVML